MNPENIIPQNPRSSQTPDVVGGYGYKLRNFSTEYFLMSINSFSMPLYTNLLVSQSFITDSYINFINSYISWLPSDNKLLSSDSKLLPSDNKLLLPNSTLLPSNSTLLPSNSVRLLSNSEQLLSDSELLLSESALLLPNNQSAIAKMPLNQSININLN
jgi:hypothetical protein